ncbi:MAG: hypothetical protein RLP44_29235 [Aggregatilineales bacterium]
MDRTVPRTGSEDIELYMRTYYSLLRSTDTIKIETLVESHMAMDSSLHVMAREAALDISALVYCALRLPPIMPYVEEILVGQIEKSFVESGYPHVADWDRVYAPGRRRRAHFDGDKTLAVFIASRSDIDDLVPMLTAYQIEWNKLHSLLQSEVARLFLAQNTDLTIPLPQSASKLLADTLQISHDDLLRIQAIWGDQFIAILQRIARSRKMMGLNLLTASLAHYRRATAQWWDNLTSIAQSMNCDAETRPVYFISSNTHSLPNLITGYAWRNEKALIGYMESAGHEELLKEYANISEKNNDGNLQNFLYYILKKYMTDVGKPVIEQLAHDETEVGIYRIPNKHGFQIDAQVIELKKLRADWLDSRLCDRMDQPLLAESDALIINIDYPLGLAAYEILARITEHVGHLLGVYVMGKAATLNARVGDVMIPNVIHDEHSQNTYLFNNCFSAQSIVPFMSYGMVLDNQKAISVPGVFLQNPTYMSVFYHEGYTDIEMEAGPYLSAVYEAYRPKRHPQNEIVNLHGVPFDVGFLHYASDRPMSKGQNLGTSNLGYAGVDPTYATSVAILRRIFEQEASRIRLQRGIAPQATTPV